MLVWFRKRDFGKMKQKQGFLTGLAVFVAGFVLLCGVLVFRSGLLKKVLPDKFILLGSTNLGEVQNISPNEDTRTSLNSIDKKADQPKIDTQNQYWAIGGKPKKVFIGAEDPNTEDPEKGFRLQLELSCYGASIKKAVFSCGDGKGFNDRNPKGPKPLVLLSPIKASDGSEIMSMANQSLVLVEQGVQLALDRFSWKPGSVKKNE